MSNTKNENNKPSKYQELNNSELEIVCGGTSHLCETEDTDAKDFVPETISFTKSQSA